MSKHGKVDYFDKPLAAARQAAADLAYSLNPPRAEEIDPGFIGVAASAVSAFGSIASWATSLANVILTYTTDEEPATPPAGGALEIAVTNQTSNPVVLYAYKPEEAEVSNVLDPLAPGETDVFLLTRRNKPFKPNHTSIELSFAVGQAEVVNVVIGFAYSDATDRPGLWMVQASLDEEDGDHRHDFPPELQLMGAAFVGDEGRYPSFSFYTAPIETGSGALGIRFLDHQGVIDPPQA